MSKAFTRESDDEPELPARVGQLAALPAGAKNYVTPSGLQQLREELARIVQQERPRVAALGDGPDVRAQLKSLDQYIQQLERSLETAVLVEPPPQPWTQVRFGATVAVRNAAGVESKYRLVGVDEVNLDLDWVSWCSPIARALLNRKIGDRVRFRAPGGEEVLEIIDISYG